MRTLLTLACLLCANVIYSASYYWGGRMLVDEYPSDHLIFGLFGRVYVSDYVAVEGVDCEMFCYANAGGVYIKQYDQTTTMDGKNSTWFLTYYSELLSLETVSTIERVPLCGWGTDEHLNGQQIENPADFYLGFKSRGEGIDGITRYGWMHLSIDDALNVSLLDSGVGLYGESVLVGIGPTPEPSAGILFVVGSLSLFLRRRKTVNS